MDNYLEHAVQHQFSILNSQFLRQGGRRGLGDGVDGESMGRFGKMHTVTEEDDTLLAFRFMRRYG